VFESGRGLPQSKTLARNSWPDHSRRFQDFSKRSNHEKASCKPENICASPLALLDRLGRWKAAEDGRTPKR
jgi:hypothetical protein